MQSAEALARVQQEDPDLLPMPTPQEVAQNAADIETAPVQRYFDGTAAVTPQDRAAGVAQIVDVAKRHALTCAGIFSSSEVVEGIFNSRGVADWYELTLAEASITMLDDSSSGWQKANSSDAKQLDPVRLRTNPCVSILACFMDCACCGIHALPSVRSAT